MEEEDVVRKPGVLLEESQSRGIIEKFNEQFRNTKRGFATNVPTACTLDGANFCSLNDVRGLKQKERLYVLFEYRKLVYVASPQELINYERQRNPWEDYDICVFDDSLNWCVGITHDQKIVVVGYLDNP